ncbi:MAG: hypothetical protein WC689_03005, partial [Methylocystis sp.]
MTGTGVARSCVSTPFGAARQFCQKRCRMRHCELGSGVWAYAVDLLGDIVSREKAYEDGSLFYGVTAIQRSQNSLIQLNGFDVVEPKKRKKPALSGLSKTDKAAGLANQSIERDIHGAGER